MVPIKRCAFVAVKLSIAIACFLSVAAVAEAVEIKVLSGSAVVPPMDVLIPQFERSTGHKVMSDFDGAIGAMTKRVENGETADVIIASRSQIDFLEKLGKVIPGSAVEVGKLGIGVFVRKGAPKPDITSVDAFKRTLLAAKSIGYNDPAAGAPVSIYLISALERLGIAEQMKPKTVVFKQRSERFAAVARGDVEIGFNQISEILAVPSVELVGPLPAAIQNYTLFTAAIVASSKQLDAAQAFVRFIASPTAATILKAKGFE